MSKYRLGSSYFPSPSLYTFVLWSIDSMNVEEMIIDNEKLVYFLINKHYRNYLYDEDVRQVGMIGLWRGCESYDPSYDIKPSTYLARCILNELHNYFEKYVNKPNKLPTISMNRLIDESGDSDNNTIEIFLEDKCEELTSIPLMLDLKDILKENEYKILSLYLECSSQTDVAKELGVTRSYVNKVIGIVRRKVDHYLSRSEKAS